jgi:hypothetical protein
MHKAMPKTVLFAWVKNVYSLRTDSGINSAYPPLSYTAPTRASLPMGVQVPSFTQVTTLLSAALSPLKNLFQPLLIADLYLVSTAPTIKKKKENKERNS